MDGFAEHLKRLREARGMTPYRLAQLTGLSQQGVLNLEQPGADPKLSTLAKLAEALGVEPWELLPGWRATRGQKTAKGGGVSPWHAGGKDKARVIARAAGGLDRDSATEPDSATIPAARKVRGKGIELAHEAINHLQRIPKSDALRRRAFEIVADFIDVNGG